MAGEKEKKKKKRDRDSAQADDDETAAAADTPKRRKASEDSATAASQSNEKPRPNAGRGVKGGGKGGDKGRGRGGGGGGGGGRGAAAEDTSRPTALNMLRPKAGGRQHTLSVALPGSIVDNAQSWELKAMLVGQIARALTIFSVDEVVLYEDRSDAAPSGDDDGLSRALAFFARNLQYLETPQYLRRQLLPFHRDLKWVGLLSPLDAPHHLRKNEKLQYREGAVLSSEHAPKKPGGEGTGCWVNCGLSDPVWVSGAEIPGDVRVTVRMEGGPRARRGSEDSDGDGEEDSRSKNTHQSRQGIAVPPREPTTKLGLYWGYQVRIASNFKKVFDECPYEGGYDLTFGTSERGEALGVSRVRRFGHLLLVFGGVGGLEEVLADGSSGYPANTDPASLFSRYVNVCPGQTSRTIRTEEAVLITLAGLSPYLPER